MSNSNQPVSELEETLRAPTVDAVESSTDEEFYAFGDGGARADPSPNQQVIRVKARNTELYRTACNKTSHSQRDKERTRMWQEEMAEEGKDSQDCSQTSSFLPANPRGCSHHQGDHSDLPNQINPRRQPATYLPKQASPPRFPQNEESRSPNTNTRRVAYSRYQVQDRIRQLHGTEEQRSQPLAPARRYGRREVCKERNSEHRRIGVCNQTDTTQEQRTFVRVLGKRF